MPQPVSYNPGTPVSGSIQENSISYVVDGQQRNYRGGFGGLSWMSEVPAANNVIFIGNSTSLGRGPANIPLFYPAYNNSSANIVYAANTLPGSPRNFTTTGSAYNWAVTNNFFINNSDNPIPRIDADGLGLYLDASQPTSYPQINTTWYDLSGYTNNGTFINGPSFNSNGWITFDGTDDRVQLSTAFVTGTGDFTVSAFVQKNTTGTNTDFIVGNYGAGNNGLELYYYNDKVFLYANGSAVLSNATINNTRWHYIVGVRSGGVGYIYIDGILDNSGGLNVNIPGNNPFTIGNGYDYNTEALNGSISEVLVYPTKALNPSEIQQNYFQGNIVTGSLVFMVDANNLVSYPKSGTSTYNLTGSGATGTLTNGTSFNISNGGSFVFDGANDYIVFPNDTNLDNQALTMESWNNPSITTQLGFLFEKGTVNTQYSNFYESSNFFFRTIGLSTMDLTFTTSTYISPNTWNHVVCTYGAGTKTIYVNGIQVAQQTGITGTIPTTTGGIYIGTHSSGYPFNGKIAESRVYNRALTASEVQQNYQATKDKFQGQQIVTNGLVLNLDAANKDSYPGTGTTIYDLSGQGANGTLINGVGYNQTNGGVLIFDGVDDGVDSVNVPQVYTDLMVGMYSEGDSGAGLEMVFAQYNYADFSFRTLNGVFRHTAINSNDFNFNETSYNYINGNLITGNVDLKNNWNIVRLVSQNASSYRYSLSSDFMNRRYKGKIAFVLAYNRILTTTEVNQNYNYFKGRFGL